MLNVNYLDRSFILKKIHKKYCVSLCITSEDKVRGLNVHPACRQQTPTGLKSYNPSGSCRDEALTVVIINITSILMITA